MRAEHPSALCSWTMAGGSKIHKTRPQDKGGHCLWCTPNESLCSDKAHVEAGGSASPRMGLDTDPHWSVWELLSVLFAAAKSHSLQEGVREAEQRGGHRHDQLGVPGGSQAPDALVRGGGS